LSKVREEMAELQRLLAAALAKNEVLVERFITSTPTGAGLPPATVVASADPVRVEVTNLPLPMVSTDRRKP